MHFFVFINISYQDFCLYYYDVFKYVEVVDKRGCILRIHGRHFRPYLSASGIKGEFEIKFTQKGKFEYIKRI